MVPVLHSSPVNPDGQMHWKLSSSRKFGLHVEFFTHGELVQGFCIRKKNQFYFRRPGRMLTQDEKTLIAQFHFNNVSVVFNVFFLRFSFISQLISIT